MSLGTFILLLVMALFGGLSDVFRKMMLKDVPEYVGLSTIMLVFAVPTGLLMLTWYGVPEFNIKVVYALSGSIPLYATTIYILFRALKEGEISLIAPIIGLTPVATMIGEFLVLGQVPSIIGMVGIAVVTMGTYMLHMHKLEDGILSPFRNMSKDLGTRYALVFVVLFIPLVPLEKMVVAESNPAVAMIAESLALGIIFAMLAAFKNPTDFKKAWEHKETVSIAAVCWSTSMVFLYAGLALTLASYVMAVRSLAILVALTLGWHMFGEPVEKRIPGASLIIAGIIMIALSKPV
ncbi:MAG: EamA family transporter [Patescibacteria group bacterium]